MLYTRTAARTVSHLLTFMTTAAVIISDETSELEAETTKPRRHIARPGRHGHNIVPLPVASNHLPIARVVMNVMASAAPSRDGPCATARRRRWIGDAGESDVTPSAARAIRNGSSLKSIFKNIFCFYSYFF
jgi:hypothetical protein